MPRLNQDEIGRLLGVNLERISSQSTTPRINTASVISSEHPANNNSHCDGNGTYTFRQRNIKLNFTLGWELEANHVPTRVPIGVNQISDGSVDDDGAEFVVMPAITKSPKYVLGLLKELVHAPRLNTNDSCGFHVHISASNLSSVARMRQWAIATEHLALQVQDLAFKAVPQTRSGNSYCRPITPITNGTSFTGRKYDNQRRYHWLNTVEMFRPGGIRTIEVRLLGHTHRWKYLLAWTLFSMELARRGWEVANHPFEVAEHKDALSNILIRIAKDIKPLEKKLEPIPEWVYSGLITFGMNADTWDRPLARLTETEADIHGVSRPFYSDDQMIEESNNSDDDEEYCPCGCGDEGRCCYQIHDDGDCAYNNCIYHHEDGNCDSLPDCTHCRQRAHNNGEDCQRSSCRICHPQSNVVNVISGTRTGRITTNNGPISEAEINQRRNELIESAMRNWNTFYSVSTPDLVDYPIFNQRAYFMLDQHEEALSANREWDRDQNQRMV